MLPGSDDELHPRHCNGDSSFHTFLPPGVRTGAGAGGRLSVRATAKVLQPVQLRPGTLPWTRPRYTCRLSLLFTVSDLSATETRSPFKLAFVKMGRVFIFRSWRSQPWDVKNSGVSGQLGVETKRAIRGEAAAAVVASRLHPCRLTHWLPRLTHGSGVAGRLQPGSPPGAPRSLPDSFFISGPKFLRNLLTDSARLGLGSASAPGDAFSSCAREDGVPGSVALPPLPPD